MREHALFDVASRQLGLVERSQTGLSDGALTEWVQAKRLTRVHPGVYRVAGAPITRHQNLLAACLAAGPGSSASHRAAAHDWDLADGFHDYVEIVTPRGQWPRLRNVYVHRSTDLRQDHVTRRNGVPMTKPLRTLVDLGQVAPRHVVADGLERGLAARLFGIKAADAALDEFSCRGRTGVGIFRSVIDERALGRGIPDGLLEPRMARLLRNHDLPPAAFQHWIMSEIRVDFAYPDLRIVIEVDGWSSRRTPAHLTPDLDRQNTLVLLGWTVLRFTWFQVVKQPDRVARTIRMTLTPLSPALPWQGP